MTIWLEFEPFDGESTVNVFDRPDVPFPITGSSNGQAAGLASIDNFDLFPAVPVQNTIPGSVTQDSFNAPQTASLQDDPTAAISTADWMPAFLQDVNSVPTNPTSGNGGFEATPDSFYVKFGNALELEEQLRQYLNGTQDNTVLQNSDTSQVNALFQDSNNDQVNAFLQDPNSAQVHAPLQYLNNDQDHALYQNVPANTYSDSTNTVLPRKRAASTLLENPRARRPQNASSAPELPTVSADLPTDPASTASKRVIAPKPQRRVQTPLLGNASPESAALQPTTFNQIAPTPGTASIPADAYDPIPGNPSPNAEQFVPTTFSLDAPARGEKWDPASLAVSASQPAQPRAPAELSEAFDFSNPNRRNPWEVESATGSPAAPVTTSTSSGFNSFPTGASNVGLASSSAYTSGHSDSPGRTVTKSPSPVPATAAGPGPVSVPVPPPRKKVNKKNGDWAKPKAFDPFPDVFKGDSEAARTYRRQSRVAGHRDPNLPAVEKNRRYWIEELYNAMTNVKDLIDKENSPHRKRFEAAQFDPVDLEAACYKIFNEAVKVHIMGWYRIDLYHKEAHRGKNVDRAKADCALRLRFLCNVLSRSKGACNDALSGGIPLRMLCYNPCQREDAKIGNNVANDVRAKRIKAGSEVLKKKGEEKSDAGAENQASVSQAVQEQPTESQSNERDVGLDLHGMGIDEELLNVVFAAESQSVQDQATVNQTVQEQAAVNQAAQEQPAENQSVYDQATVNQAVQEQAAVNHFVQEQPAESQYVEQAFGFDLDDFDVGDELLNAVFGDSEYNVEE